MSCGFPSIMYSVHLVKGAKGPKKVSAPTKKRAKQVKESSEEESSMEEEEEEVWGFSDILWLCMCFSFRRK